MIYFLYGKDTFRSQKKLEEIIEQYKKAHKSGLNLIKIDAEEKEFSDFSDNFKIVPMFDEKKLLIITGLFSAKGGPASGWQEEFLKELEIFEASKDIIVVFEKEPVDKKNKLFLALKKSAKCQEFNFLDNRKMFLWLEQELKNRNAKIEPLAKNIFLNCVGNDLWLAENEIKKLADFKRGYVIKKEDVELMIRPKIENDIFRTVEAIAKKDKSLALSLLQKHVDSGDNVLYLLAMVAYQFRNLLVIKDLMEKKNSYEQIIKKSGLHPFVVKKNYYLCNQFSMAQLKKIYQQIFEADCNIKTGKIEPELALELLISGI